ncbi:hypothetical protein [Persicobacter psychrovividus]|uniref:Capsule assembly Wzi family protein n=1 Tax=Persicobacter psychrovividus TaxID=387638 RepID=A0ABN6L608_9BACT|nr:hypothetical protein PEPS_09010 [Persicobacter psychrovividus]
MKNTYPSAKILSFLAFFMLFFQGYKVIGQRASVPLNDDYYYLIQRFEGLSGKQNPQLHTTVLPYRRDLLVPFLQSLDQRAFSRVDQFNYQYLLNDSWEASSDSTTGNSQKTIWNTFFKKQSDFLMVNTPRFDVHVNPVIYFAGGVERKGQVAEGGSNSQTLFQNTRGVEVRGQIGQKVGFYSFLGTTQAVFPSYVQNQFGKYRSLPGEGYVKDFKENGFDYFTSRGYFTFDFIPEINVRAGYDQVKVGEGLRSMILSNNANSYLFAQLTTQVWKLQYTSIYAQMAALPSDQYLGSETYSKGFGFHRLGLNIGKKANIGLFETVNFGGYDSLAHRPLPMPLTFYNPIIFFRGMELESGSYFGKMQIGLDWKWYLTPGLKWYGQFVLDEFNLNMLKENDGWWAMKFAVQSGLAWYNVGGVNNLDLQIEGNLARPYTYNHKSPYSAMTHYGASLAHPLGSNFYELLAVVRAQPFPRLSLVFQGQYAIYGQDYLKEDGTETNFGSDPMKDYDTRESDTGNYIGQGNTTRQLMADMRASYQLKHNLFIDGRLLMRQVQPEMTTAYTDITTTMSLRWNIGYRSDFY